MRLVAIDPGQNNGCAIFEDNKPIWIGTLQWDIEFLDWLNSLQGIEVFVYEDYFIDTDRYDHRNSKAIPIRSIGAICLRAFQLGALAIPQREAIKPIAYGYLGQTYVKGKKNMHHMDAVAHGHYYLVKTGAINLESRRQSSEKRPEPSGNNRKIIRK